MTALFETRCGCCLKQDDSYCLKQNRGFFLIQDGVFCLQQDGCCHLLCRMECVLTYVRVKRRIRWERGCAGAGLNLEKWWVFLGKHHGESSFCSTCCASERQQMKLDLTLIWRSLLHACAKIAWKLTLSSSIFTCYPEVKFGAFNLGVIETVGKLLLNRFWAPDQLY